MGGSLGAPPIRGLYEGFRTGFQWGTPLESAASNMLSTRLRPDLIEEYISKESGKGRMIGPLPMSWTHHSFESSRIGTQGPQFREVQAHYGPVVSTWSQRERRHQPGSGVTVIHCGG